MSFITTLDWMLKLDLNLSEMQTFACIYGFSQDGKSFYYGGVDYLASWVKQSSRNVMRNLNSLVDKGLIIKEEQFSEGFKYVRYKVNFEAVRQFVEPNDNLSQDGGQFVTEPYDKMSHNNKYIINNKKDNKITPLPPYEDVYFHDDKDEVLKEWLDYRKSIKKPLKDKSVENLVKQIKELDLNVTQLKECVNNSISQGYQGLFFDKYKPKKPRYDWANL